MPGKVKVKIIAGRNLPVMDRSSDTTDAYVEIKLGNTTYKTDVCRKSLNPQWNSEWYRFEVDDSELQDEPLQIRLMDHDTYSANDAIGKVYMNLNPLLIPVAALPGKYGWSGESNVDQPSSSVMSGWIPVYDTMHGIRGEVNVTVKVELFSDFNKFRQSSCGVQFFCSPVIPHGYHAQVIHGFIEELVVNDDPEYQWIDKIRTPRASNEARQTLFFKLSGELQRKIGVKALDLGGNAVIGYNQCFDLEGESGIVARGIGTVVSLIKHHEMQQQLDIGIAEEKALSYLKFLASDNGLKLENDNVFERFTLSSPIPNTAVFVSTSDTLKLSPRKNNPIFLRQSSQPLIEYEPLPTSLKTCISSRSLSDDIREEIALRQMLRQEEMKGTSNVGLSRKIKYFKQNMLYKKMNVLKTKLSDASMQESLNLDTASISSGRETIRTSLIDLRELRKKRKQSNSSYMAELLVKSVIQAHTSLDCIVECHDSGPLHATSTSALNEDTEEDSSHSHKSSDSQNTVLEVAPTGFINKTISEPYLLLPDTAPVTPSMNSSSDSDMSSSDGYDSPSETKDKLEFDTVSLIVKKVQDEEYKQRRLSQVQNIVQESATAPILLGNINLFEFPVNTDKPIDQIVQNAVLNITDTLQPRLKGQLQRALSRSCTDIAAANELKSNAELNTSDNNKTETIVMLPTDIEKRIEKLRHSALFRSIAERPQNKLNKTFSISCEDMSTTTNEGLLPPNTIIFPKSEKKRRLSKALSISCEEIWSPNIVEIEKRIDKLRDSALFKSINKKPEPRKRGKLQRTFSISCDEEINNLDNKTVALSADIEKRIENLMLSPLFGNNERRKKGKMNRALSRSCADISSPNTEINEGITALQSRNVDKKLGMFKNSPLFKISILAEPPGKMNTELSSTYSDILSPDRIEINKSKNIEKKINMFKNSPLFKISILTEPKSKGKMNRELSRSYTDITTTDKYDDNDENNSKSNPDLTNISLVKTAMHTMLSEKINLLTSQPAPISPRSSEQLLCYQSNPNLANNSLVKNAVQTILMEKVDLMTAQHAPLSKRVQEEFQKNVAKSVSRSDPDITSHFIKSAVNKIHIFPTKSPSFLRKSRGSYTGSLKHTTFISDPNLLDHTSVKSLIMDKIHIFTSKSPTLSRKFNGETEAHSSTHSEVNGNSLVKTAMETILMDKINILTPPVSSDGEKVFDYPNQQNVSSTSQPDNYDSHDQADQSVDVENDSLFQTAMQTMLLDKVNIMASSSPPVAPVTEEPNIKSSKHPHLDKIKTTVHNVFDKVHILSPKSTDKKFFSQKSESSLMKTAMQTMLIDKVNIIAPDAAPLTEEKSNLDETKHSKHEHPNLDKIKAVVHTVQDKISSLSPTSHGNKFDFNKDESDSNLMKTAMQTMLIDKVNILSPEASSAAAEETHDDTKHTKHEHLKLDKVKEAVHTVIDKMSSLSPTSPKLGHKFEFNNESEPSLTKTAMQTMLIDKVNILAPEATSVAEEDVSHKHETKHEHLDKVKAVMHNVFDKVHHLPSLHHKDKKVEEFDEENQSLMKTAMQTMLLDKINIIAPNSPSMSKESREFQYEQNISHKTKEPEFEEEKENIENQSLVKTAMQTMLMEQVNIGSPESVTMSYPTQETVTHETQSSSKSDTGKKHSIFYSIKKKCKSLKSKLIHKDSHKQKAKEEGLVESAMSAMLMDRVNIINSTDEMEPSLTPIEPPPKACNNKQKLDITLTAPSTEEPNITVRPDTGDSCNRTTAVTADDANCNTNAEHAPCLYTSDRRIVESPVPAMERERERERDRENVRERHGHQRTESTGGKMSQSPARLNAIPCIHRRSSDSDLSITPKGNSLTGSDRSGGTIPGYHHIRSTLLRPTVDNFDMMEYPFLTMSKYPPGFILHLGGAVSARSVKLLERITNIEEPETRDTWWSELRMEIRTHARALNCNAVLGYTESTSICDEVCVLSASGTAAVIALYSGELSDGVSGLPNLHKPHIPNKDLMTSSLDRTDFERDKNSKHSEAANTNNKITQVTESPEHEATIEFSGSASVPSQPTSCRICHIPYSESSMSFRINMLYCSICKMAKVPDILLTTIEMPEGLPITGRGCFLQSYVCRPKRDLKGELNAKEISESLPFLEYELHRLLVNKMKVKAMNTIFGLKVRITIGERMLIGIATGTAVFLLPLPPAPLPKLIAGNSTTEDKRLADMQKLLVDTVKKNKEIYELKDIDTVQPSKLLSDAEESDDEKSNIDLGAGNKDSCVLEVDDAEDIEVINLLVEPRPPDGFHVVNTENVPGLEELEIVKNLQMFTQVWRAKIPLNQSASHFGKHFQKLLQSVYFKLRRMIPCALCDLQFRVDLPEPDEIQLTLLGMALGLGDPLKLNKFKRKNLCHLPSKELCKKADDELIFSLEEDHIPENSIPVISQGSLLNPQMPKHRQKSPQRLRANTKQRHTPVKERHGVDITPLSYVPGGKIERYLGYLNFFFIRETTSIREGGGLSGFVHSFITEVLAIVRAHVTALGGNAMVAYFMTECVLYHNAHKNQGQCLINVGGDVVFVSYFTEDN